jgi:hypothetical protein
MNLEDFVYANEDYIETGDPRASEDGENETQPRVAFTDPGE